MKSLTERKATWMRDTRKIVLALVFTLFLFVAIALTTRNYFVREMLAFFAGFAALFVVGLLIADLFILLQEVWKQANSWVRLRIERISSVRYSRPSPLEKVGHSSPWY